MTRTDSTKPLVSICIATRNRKDALAVCIESCRAQDYRPIEIVVYDDASADGTPDEIRRLFPDVRCVSTTQRVGQAGLRDRGFRECAGDYVFSLDDDAYFSDPTIVRHTLEDFQNDPSIGAVGIPFVEPVDRASHHEASVSPREDIRSFYGCAYAIRRSAAVECGGYRAFFQAHVEERDLCIRLLDHGKRVVYGSAPPVVHVVHPAGERWRVQYLGVRNTLLFDCLNIPHPYAIPKFIVDMGRMIAHKLTLFSAPRRVLFVVGGILACLRHGWKRRAVSKATYETFIRLPGHPPLPWTGALPSPAKEAVPSRTDS